MEAELNFRAYEHGQMYKKGFESWRLVDHNPTIGKCKSYFDSLIVVKLDEFSTEHMPGNLT